MLLDTCHIQDHLTGHMISTVVGNLGEIVGQKLYQLLSAPLHNCTKINVEMTRISYDVYYYSSILRLCERLKGRLGSTESIAEPL